MVLPNLAKEADDEGGFLRRRRRLDSASSPSSHKKRQTPLLWITTLVAAIAAATVYSTSSTTAGKGVTVSGEAGNVLDSSDSKNPRVPGDANVLVERRYHNMSFPGMDDHTTHLECCPARLIVKLERHYSYNLPSPFSLLMYNHSMCESEAGASIETHPSCGITPLVSYDDGLASTTIPEWVENSVMHDFDTEGYDIFYNCAVLTWDSRSCPEYMATLADNPSDIHIVQRNLSLLNGEFTATVALTPRSCIHGNTSILVPDAFDSCWRIGCAYSTNGSTKECIDFAVNNLVRVSLEEYVNATKRAECE